MIEKPHVTFIQIFLGYGFLKILSKELEIFFEYTTAFINSSDFSLEDKVDLQHALYTYLKTDQGATIRVSGFAEQFLDENIRDDYSIYMENQNFPSTAVSKDISLITRRLKNRKMNFSSNVKITAPSEVFNEVINVIEETNDKTTLEISGRLLNQES